MVWHARQPREPVAGWLKGVPMKQPDRIEFPSQMVTKRTDPLWTSQDVADFRQVTLRWVEKRRAHGVLPCLALPAPWLVRYDPERFEHAHSDARRRVRRDYDSKASAR